jgi:hypothetical protein
MVLTVWLLEKTVVGKKGKVKWTRRARFVW